jgi:hypothetical protein
VRLYIDIPPATHDALMDEAIRNRRGARDEAAVLVIAALARRGLISKDGLRRNEPAPHAEPAAAG